MITDEQVEELLTWLVHDYWSPRRRLYACIWCGSDTRPLKGQGLCRRCYYVYRRMLVRLDLPTSVDHLCRAVEKVLETRDISDGSVKFLERALSWLRAGKGLSRLAAVRLAQIRLMLT